MGLVSETRSPPLAERLRLIVITDAHLAAPRSVEAVVGLALGAGAPAIQLRDKVQGMGALLPLASRLRELTRQASALFFVNDRVDLALAVEADGAHLGPDDLPVSAVREIVPAGFLIGFSTDDPLEARRAVEEGADYLGTGTVFPTASKADAGLAIGPEGVARVSTAVAVPVVAIGGISLHNARSLSDTGAAGIAVIGAVMGAADPAAAVRALMSSWTSGGGQG